MTRREFENISTWEELCDFCYEYDLDTLDNILDIDDVCSEVGDIIDRNYSYEALDKIRRLIYNTDLDAERYIITDGMCVELNTTDFEEYKEEVLEEFYDQDNIFDEEVIDGNDCDWFDDNCVVHSDVDIEKLTQLVGGLYE